MTNKEAIVQLTNAVNDLKTKVTSILAYIQTIKQEDVSGNLADVEQQIQAVSASLQAVLPQ
jgi:predicted ribosome quality control (RQC) complex YloA/Tae2 family protein